MASLEAKTLGISVGDARRVKTESELDVQAQLLKKIHGRLRRFGVVLNLHNHTYEVGNGLHDLKGTLARIPDIKLGPDLNWLVRAGVDPVWFIKTYGHQMVYMHIRDQYQDGTWTEYVGQGVTDFPGIAAALRSVDFKGRAAIELAFPENFVPRNPLAEDWKKSRITLRPSSAGEMSRAAGLALNFLIRANRPGSSGVGFPVRLFHPFHDAGRIGRVLQFDGDHSRRWRVP